VAIQLRLRLIHPHSARFTVSNWKFTTEAGGIITHPATPQHAGDLMNRLNSKGGCKIRQPRMKAFALTVALGLLFGRENAHAQDCCEALRKEVKLRTVLATSPQVPC